VSDSDLRSRLQDLFRTLFWAETLPPERMSRVTCPTWDSLAQVEVILSLEEEFGITVSDADALNLDSFDAALALVSSKGK
jgi:acyl carrier protein